MFNPTRNYSTDCHHKSIATMCNTVMSYHSPTWRPCLQVGLCLIIPQYTINFASDFYKIFFFFAASGFSRGTEPDTRRVKRAAGVEGNSVFIDDDTCRFKLVRRFSSTHTLSTLPHINTKQM